ncbi:MAG: putative DNA binding domain-containing protein [Treponema sp.]|nr:putative DNA binding domain-containing protein [Treponema sp.]
MALDLKRIEGGENLNTEFKREYTEDIKKTIIAFANTSGGMLYIGINDDGTAAGVDSPDNTMLQVTNVVRSAIKPDLAMFVDCRAEKLGNATVIAVTVQKGTACPYYLAGKGIRPEGVYMRLGASSVQASEAAIFNMVKETGGERFEAMPSLNQDLTFDAAERFFERAGIPFATNHRKTLHMQTTDGMYTNLGLLFSDQAVHSLKLAVFDGPGKEIFKDRREFSGSILSQMEDAHAFLEMHNHTYAKVEKLYRKDRRDYPEDALREALLNALVHRDYAFPSCTLISIFDDRIEFVSAGSLPKGVFLDDIMLGLSMPRNTNLAEIFYRLRLVEAYGTGIPRIMRSYAEYARKPELQASSNAFKITLPNRNAILPAPAGNETIPLTENEEKAIALLESRDRIVRGDVEAALNISQAMAVRVLRGLVEKGAVRVVGGGTKTRYEKP